MRDLGSHGRLYDWQGVVEEWALHRWLRENGAAEGEIVLLQADDLTYADCWSNVSLRIAPRFEGTE